MAILKLEKLTKKYGNQKVLKSIDLSLEKGKVVCVMGPSGCGKTTLIKCISMLENIDQGLMVFNQQGVVDKDTSEKEKEKLRKRIGVVFQDFHLWPHKTVLENIIEAPLLLKKGSKSALIKKARAILKQVDLLNKANCYPNSLSGGQKQRAAIARTLIMEPDLLLLDEVTSALDPALISGVLEIIKKLAQQGMTMIVVTHHLRFAHEIADRIVLMDKGEIVKKNGISVMLKKPETKQAKEMAINKKEKVMA